MPTATRNTTTECISNRGLRVAALASLLHVALLMVACDRFERINPHDPEAELGLELVRGDEPLVINDAVSLGDKNNENDLVEPEEKVEITVPVEVRRSPGGLTASVRIRNDSGSDCVASSMQQGVAPEVVFPATTGLETEFVTAGPFALELAREGCDPDTPLDFALEFDVLQLNAAITVPFEVTLVERDGEIELGEVDVDDRAGDDDGVLDPEDRSAELDIKLRNRGDAVLRDVELELLASRGDCVIKAELKPDDPLEFGDIDADKSASAMEGGVEIDVGSDCDVGDELSLRFEARDNAGQSWRLDWSYQLGQAADAGMD